MLWNVEGLTDMLRMGIYCYFEKFDILLLNETFDTQKRDLRAFYVFDELASKQNVGRPSGGLLLAVKAHLTPKPGYQSKHCIVVDTLNLVIVCCYFSPTCDIFTLIDEIASCLCSLQLSKPLLFCGDFNARMDTFNSGVSDKSEILNELMEDFGLSLMNNCSESTYVCQNGKSVIDLVYSNFRIDSIELEKDFPIALLRKHIPVKVSVKIPKYPSRINPAISQPKKQRIVGNINLNKLGVIEETLGSNDLNLGNKLLCDCILDSVPDVQPKHCNSDNMITRNKELSLLKIDLIKLHKEVLKNPLVVQNYVTAKRLYKNKIKDIKKEQALTLESNRLKEAELLPWKLNPKRNGSISSNIPLEEWEPHFSQLYNPDLFHPSTLPAELMDFDYSVISMMDNLDESWFLDTDDTELLNSEITQDEVESILRTCKDKKAIGLDQIANEHLKGSFNVVGYLWVLLFNMILLTGSIVESWRSCMVKVLYKGKGCKRDPNAYRGIAFLSHPYKLFTKLLSKRLYKFVEGRSLPDEQFGFRRGKSTTEAIKILRTYVKGNLPRGHPVYALFVDFRKAFDLVPRQKLLFKLATIHNVRGKILKVLVSILAYSMIKVFDGLSYSEDILQVRGVQQGDSLSPLLFIMFIADLPALLKSAGRLIQILMFADDLVFYSTCKQEIQQALNLLSDYCRKNSLEVNLDKTKVLKFRRGGTVKSDVFTYDGEIVEHCSSYEYLGITLQPQWCFTKHLKKKRMKACATTYCIKDLQKLSLPAAEKYFRIMIQPIITYGIECI